MMVTQVFTVAKTHQIEHLDLCILFYINIFIFYVSRNDIKSQHLLNTYLVQHCKKLPISAMLADTWRSRTTMTTPFI